MTRTTAGEPAEAGSGWLPAWPELVVAAILVIMLSVAGFAFAGPGAAALVLIIAAASGLAALRVLVQPHQPDPGRPAAGHGHAAIGPHSSFTGFWRRRAELADGAASMSAYDVQLRVTLQTLLAARLAEHHGISLARDPDAARRLLCPAERDAALWFWIDPARPPVRDGGARSGIPARTLATLMDRLERL